MKLLVPVDGSCASINAVKKAIEIAKKHDFSIKLLAVVDSGHLTVDESYEEKRKESLRNLLDSIVERLEFSGIATEKEVLVGEPALEILDTAQKERMDLIVIGNRGFSKIKRFFLGSVAQRVIAEAPCPVLVIHTDADY